MLFQKKKNIYAISTTNIFVLKSYKNNSRELKKCFVWKVQFKIFYFRFDKKKTINKYFFF